MNSLDPRPLIQAAVLSLIAWLLCLVLLGPHAAAAQEQELDVINRPVNVRGLTGFLVTTSPYTMPAGSFEISLGALSEQSNRPDFSLNQMPSLACTYGWSRVSELSFKTSYVHTSFGQERQARGAGDVDLSWKMNVYRPAESGSTPAVSVFFTGMLPLTNKSETSIGGVNHWGAKLGVSAGRELSWGEQVIAISADAQVILRDLNDDRFRDRYSEVNIGLLLPISKSRNLQVIAEYGIVNGVDKETVDMVDHTALAFGLRLVTEKFNMTIGSQFLRKRSEGYDDSSRIIGTTSLKF